MSIKIPKPKTIDPIENNIPKKEDFGFGEKFTGIYSRLLNDDGSFNISRTGLPTFNIFKKLITLSWWKLLLYFILSYLIINLLFAIIYYLGGENSIENVEEGSFLYSIEQLFYFSVQTFTTVGYGKLNPVSSYANLISTFNAFAGLLFFAMVTGLFFFKFSTPVDHIIFSKNIIIAPFKNKKALMVRLANTIDNHIINLNARITMSWIEMEENVPRRKFASLQLEIDAIYLFPLNWTLVHIINEDSPLYNKEKSDLLPMNTEFIIMLNGYDRNYSKVIQSNRSYVCKDLIYGAVFEPMYESKNKETILHLDKIDEVRPYNLDNYNVNQNKI